jgi:hypothetical protein
MLSFVSGRHEGRDITREETSLKLDVFSLLVPRMWLLKEV